MWQTRESSPPFGYCKQIFDYGNRGSPFEALNLTAFEAEVANQLCSIRWANHNVNYQLDQHHHELQLVTIASLVLNAVTVGCILIYSLSRLYSYCRTQMQPVIL
ncbi:hypothetical protein BCR42DRAFT_396966 [Absidia repens]|uniref:Uncharacterized protein n=1 Tax=Absidia repens TaxID=90262 RepID=A0A1X2I2W9_9FUNG|nr:hypothetical protein BCR42DRAFT_396966 [Absidia repens]